MQARRVEHLFVIGVVVGAEACNHAPMVVVVEDILGKHSGNLLNTQERAVFQVFIVFVVSITGTHGIGVMVVDDVGVKQ